MYKQIIVCVLSSTLLLVASDEVNRKNKGKQRQATTPLAIPSLKSQNQKDRFIKLQYLPQLDSNNLLTVCTYGRYTGGISSEENSPRDGSLSY